MEAAHRLEDKVEDYNKKIEQAADDASAYNPVLPHRILRTSCLKAQRGHGAPTRRLRLRHGQV
jgi:hypothetical protein